MIHACAISPKISLLRRKWDLQRLRVLPKCMQLEKDSDFWTGSMMVPNMSVITHYLILTSRKIQLPSTLGSTSWLRLGLLSKLEEIFLPEDPFSLGACKHPSAIIRFCCLQPSHQCFHPLPGYNDTRLPCPWDSPGKNTGVGCHFLLQWESLTKKLIWNKTRCDWGITYKEYLPGTLRCLTSH